MENGLPEGGHQGIWDPDHCEYEVQPGTLKRKTVFVKFSTKVPSPLFLLLADVERCLARRKGLEQRMLFICMLRLYGNQLCSQSIL